MKKILAIVLVLVMVMGLASTAFAAPAGTSVTINNPNYNNLPEGVAPAYKAYKILTANVDSTDTNYAYKVNDTYRAMIIATLGLTGDGISDKVIIDAIRAKDAEGMRHFAGELYDRIMASGIDAEANWTTNSTTLPEGYWLIADVTPLDGLYLSNSVVMIDTVGSKNVTVNAKPDVLEGGKYVDDENDSIMNPTQNNEDATNLQDVADYDIGDNVPFVLTAEIPSNATTYKYYALVMQDTLSKGLTVNTDSFRITVNNHAKTIGPKGTARVDFWYETAATTLANNEPGTILYVYPAHGYQTYELIDKEANAANGGDYLKLFAADTAHNLINSVDIVFSYTAKLNENAKTGIDGNPNYYSVKFSNDPDGDSFGETPIDTNIVLTYKVNFDKTDPNGEKLSGADFDLYKFIALAGVVDLDGDDFDEDDEAAAKAAAIAALPSGVAETDLFRHPAAVAYGYFEKVTRETVSSDGASFTFNGLDDGYYKIVESVVPDGYNGIEPIEFRIVATHVTSITDGTPILTDLEGRTKTVGEITFSKNTGEGSLSATIENHTGAELPTTGGIGTTIFYILGSVLVLGAVVVLVTKRRMGAEG